MSLSQILHPLLDHPFKGPFLTVDYDARRVSALGLHCSMLEGQGSAVAPQLALAQSWYATAYGAEAFEEGILSVLRASEPVIRRHYPAAHRVLAMNLAAQGCHIWFLHTREKAIAPLQEAFDLMLNHQIAIEADIVKVAEVLADCLSECGRLDEALVVLFRAKNFFLAALEQDDMTSAQYDEFREQFIDEYGDECSSDLQYMVEVLRGPRVCDWDEDLMPKGIRILSKGTEADHV